MANTKIKHDKYTSEEDMNYNQKEKINKNKNQLYYELKK